MENLIEEFGHGTFNLNWKCEKGGTMRCGSWLKPHHFVISGTPGEGVMASCSRCKLRTPVYPWENGTWAKDLFKRAEKEGTLTKEEDGHTQIHRV